MIAGCRTASSIAAPHQSQKCRCASLSCPQAMHGVSPCTVRVATATVRSTTCEGKTCGARASNNAGASTRTCSITSVSAMTSGSTSTAVTCGAGVRRNQGATKKATHVAMRAANPPATHQLVRKPTAVAMPAPTSTMPATSAKFFAGGVCVSSVSSARKKVSYSAGMGAGVRTSGSSMMTSSSVTVLTVSMTSGGFGLHGGSPVNSRYAEHCGQYGPHGAIVPHRVQVIVGSVAMGVSWPTRPRAERARAQGGTRCGAVARDRSRRPGPVLTVRRHRSSPSVRLGSH